MPASASSSVRSSGSRRLLGRPRARQHEQRQPLEPAGEVAEPAQRRRVGPVEVVDREHRRAAGAPRSPRASRARAGSRTRRRLPPAARARPRRRRAGRRARPRRRAAPRARSGGAVASIGSNSCRTIPNAKPCSISAPRADRTPSPRSAASARASASSLVLPIPARPSIATTRPAPPSSASTTAPIAASSASRSSSGGPTRRGAAACAGAASRPGRASRKTCTGRTRPSSGRGPRSSSRAGGGSSDSTRRAVVAESSTCRGRASAASLEASSCAGPVVVGLAGGRLARVERRAQAGRGRFRGQGGDRRARAPKTARSGSRPRIEPPAAATASASPSSPPAASATRNVTVPRGRVTAARAWRRRGRSAPRRAAPARPARARRRARSTKRSSSGSGRLSGGSTLTTFMPWPATWVRMRCRVNSGTTTSWAKMPGCRRSSIRYVRRPRSGSPSSIAHIRPSPRTSRTDGWRSPSSRVSSSSRSPSRAERSTRPSRVELVAASRAPPPSPGRSARRSSRARRRSPSSRRRRRGRCRAGRSAPTGHVAARERLRHRDEVGLEAPVLEREHAAGAAEAGLHLVDAEERPVAAAELLRALEVAGLGEVDALALHGLDEEERDVLARELALERLEVVERHAREAGEQRLEAVAELGAAARGQRAERQAVEAVLGRDDARPLRRGAAELDRRLDRLGAGVREEDAVDRGGQPLDERLREPRGDRRDAELHRVRRLRLQVLDQRRLDARVVAADREHAEAAEQVEVLGAVRVGEVRAVRARPALVEADRPQHADELRVDRARPRLERVVPVASAVRARSSSRRPRTQRIHGADGVGERSGDRRARGSREARG